MARGCRERRRPVVTFTGTPDIPNRRCRARRHRRPTLSVNPGQTVDFVNHLGKTATLGSSTAIRISATRKWSRSRSRVVRTHHHRDAAGLHARRRRTRRADRDRLAPAADRPRPRAQVRHLSPRRRRRRRVPARAGHRRRSTRGRRNTRRQHRATATPSRSPWFPAPATRRRGIADRAAAAGGTQRCAVRRPDQRDTDSRSASGLLTLIATVSVGGVTAAVIRAIVAHRATRSLMD